MFTPDRSSTPVSATFPTGSSSQLITRSRTLYFLSIRSTFGHPSPSSRTAYGGQYGQGAESDDDEAAGLMGSRSRSRRDKGKGKEREGTAGRGGEVRIEMSGLPPIWVDTADEISTLLDQAKTKIATLDKMHAKHVLPGFKDRSAEERDIEALTMSITKDFRKTQDLIRRIQPQEASEAEATSTLNLQRGLAAKVQDLSAKFRKKQRSYMEKLQGHASKSEGFLKTSGAAMLMSTEQEKLALEEDLQATDQLQATSRMDSTIRQRTNEITNIAKSINELADLFRDMGDLVVEQGTMMDSIEYNLETVGREMKASVEELEIATKYQKNTGRRKCMFLLVLIIVALVLVLIYKPRTHSTTTPLAPATSSVAALYPPIPGNSTSLHARCKIPLNHDQGRLTGGGDGRGMSRRTEGRDSRRGRAKWSREERRL